MVEGEWEIPTNDVQNHFRDFLAREGNKRIFFSGKYGVGKTFFLQEFFKLHKKDYDVYHLYPVRYQISSNENIVELFKYDIFAQLLEKYPKAFNSPKKYRVRYCWNSVKYHVCNIARRTLEDAKISFEVIGIPVNIRIKVVKAFRDIVKKFNLYSEGIPKEFMEKAKEECSTAADHISIFISYKIKELKGERESVLILDDFDRIYPEHIFRILNVFSAHMEGDEENKFGFDRVIIVADINNIKNIFHHRYGEQTEFQGYFDKFFTLKPYIFDNNEAVMERIPSLLEYIQFPDDTSRNKFFENNNRSSQGIITGQDFLEEVLLAAWSIQAVNLRQLYKPINKIFVELKFHERGEFDRRDLRNQYIDVGIKLLMALYGDREDFMKTLVKIKDKASHDLIPLGVGRGKMYNHWATDMVNKVKTNIYGEPANKMKGGSTLWLDKYSLGVRKEFIYVSPEDAEDGKEHQEERYSFYFEDGGISSYCFYQTLIEYVRTGTYDTL